VAAAATRIRRQIRELGFSPEDEKVATKVSRVKLGSDGEKFGRSSALLHGARANVA
jgi:hypothetical protein